MPNRRSILSRAEWDTLFAIPADPTEISRIYAFDADDLALIQTGVRLAINLGWPCTLASCARQDLDGGIQSKSRRPDHLDCRPDWRGPS